MIINNQALVVSQNNSAIKRIEGVDGLISRWTKFVDRTEQTTRMYNFAAKKFVAYLQENNLQLSRDSIIAFRDNLVAEKKSASTVKMYLNVAKKFVQWLYVEGFIERDFTLNIHAPKVDNNFHKRAALNANESKTVIDKMPIGDNEEVLRNSAIIKILICCGCRAIEICRLTRGDLKTLRGKNFLNVLGKGKTEKILVSLPKQAYLALQNYLVVREKRVGHIADNAPMFCSLSDRCKDKSLSTQTVSRIAKKSLKAAGFNGREYTCHSLRHSAASICLNARDNDGKRIVTTRDIKIFLRHSSEKISEVYLHDESFFNNACAEIVASRIFAA